MSYKTLDGFELQEGDGCFVALECSSGKHKLSPCLRATRYMDATAKHNGWQFTTVHPIKVDCEDIEVIGVWRCKC